MRKGSRFDCAEGIQVILIARCKKLEESVWDS